MRRRPVVLVVDDNEAVRETLRLSLEDTFEVRAARDGPTALELVRGERIDVVLLDIVMPGMDGIEVLARIKDQRADTPVIALSGLDAAATATEAMKLGAFDYVTKPFKPDTLVPLIRSALKSPKSRLTIGRLPAGPSSPPRGAEDILLVGRDVPFLASLKILLKTAQAASLASTVVAVLRRLTQARPSLALIDDSIEWHDLKEVARILRASCPDCTVIIGCSPARNPTTVQELTPYRPYVLMPKPYDVNELLERIRSLCALKRPLPLPRRLLSAHVTRALSYVCRHYSAATSEEAARAAGVSVGHLAHSFRAELEMTFWDFVTAVRLEIVKDLLSETDYKQEHIAQLVGFSDGPHLSRVFRQHMGRSPGHYRQSMIGMERGRTRREVFG